MWESTFKGVFEFGHFFFLKRLKRFFRLLSALFAYLQERFADILRHNRKLTSALIRSICDRVSEGEDIRAIAESVEIARSTIYNWLSRGESSRSDIYHQFFREYRRARAAYEASIIHVVIEGTKTRSKEKTLAAKLKITPRTWQNWKVRGESEASGFITIW